MKSKDLLSQLFRLESMLSDFSFEELNTKEASNLKKSFLAFKSNLEMKVFGLPIGMSDDGHTGHFGEKTDFDSMEDNHYQVIEANALIANVSHEMRTPLNGIIGFADLLKEDRLSTGQLEKVDAIQTASYSLLEIINELLDYSKLSAGLEDFQSVDFNIYALVRDVVYLCNTLITKSKVRLETSMNPDIPMVLVGDPSKLTQILLNLLGNAIKFVEEGNIHLTVRQEKQIKNTFFIEFSISDTGIGISEENIAHIFDAFKQAEQDTFIKHGGSGLGLNIVKQIVQGLGGEITVISDLGVGSTFRFSLPYQKGDTKKVSTRNKDTSDDLKNVQLVKNLNILVFEDNLLNQRLVEHRLNTWGCRTFLTDNAEYGLNILKTNRIDIVLMDLRMPGMSGYEVTEHIRKSDNAHMRQVPIIALTADFTAKDNAQCTELGINDFILKPYSPDELLFKIIKHKSAQEGNVSMPAKTVDATKDMKSQSQPIDLAPLLEECTGDLDVLEDLVRLFKQNAHEFMAQAQVHIQNSDFEKLKFLAHKIKSGLKMLKANDLLKIVLQMHEICETGNNKADLKTCERKFSKEYTLAEKSVDEQLKKLKHKS